MRLNSIGFRGGRRGRGRVHRRILKEFSRTLLLVQDREAVEASLSARIRELVPVRALVVFHQAPERDQLEPGYGYGMDPAALTEAKLDPGGRLIRWLRVNETHLLLPLSPDVRDHLDLGERELLGRLETDLCIPLFTQDRLTGLALVTLDDPRRSLSSDEREVLELLAQQGALALENAALYELQRQRLQRLHRTERLAAVGQLAAKTAHEIRNPLTAIRSTMQYLARGLEDEPRHGMVEDLLEEVDRIDDILNELLQLTREGPFEPVALDPVEAVSQVLALVEAQAEEQGVILHRSLATHTPRIEADPHQLRQLLLNLVLNALQAMPEGGELTFRVAPRNGHGGAEEDVAIEISDTGPGIQPDVLEKIFDPFYTTKKEGTGLGLAISHRIVERHQGQLRVMSAPGAGTTFLILLPVSPWPES